MAVLTRFLTGYRPYAFVLPLLLGLLVLTYGPTLFSVGLLFCQWDLLGPVRWVGLANISQVLAAPWLWQSVGVSLVYVLLFVVGVVSVGLAMALLYDGLSGWRRFGPKFGMGLAGLLQGVALLPFVVPLSSMVLVFQSMLTPGVGILSGVFSLSQPLSAMACMVAIQIWKQCGYVALLLWVGFRQISTEQREAAMLDGANLWQLFCCIQLPQLKPALVFVATVSIMNGYQAFDAVYLLTQGGPNGSTQFLVYRLYQKAFEQFETGPASVVAMVLFALTLATAVLKERCLQAGADTAEFTK